MSPVAFVNRLTPEAEAAWLDHLRAAMPEETIIPFASLTDQDRANITVAIVANPEPSELARLTSLEWVQSLWAGVERMVAELPDFSKPIVRMIDPQLARNMSEAALAWTYYLFRDMPAYAQQQRQHLWQQLPYRRAEDVTVGILGLGELGTASAQRIAAQGFRVMGWSRTRKDLPGVSCHSGEDGLTTVLGQSDIIIVLLPVTPRTHHILNAETLARTRRGAGIINFARGGIIDTQALTDALARGQISHAVLDVFEAEPLPVTSDLWDHPKITVLPHISAPTDPRTGAAVAAANIRQWRRDGSLPQAISMSRGY